MTAPVKPSDTPCNFDDNEGRCTVNDGFPCEACMKLQAEKQAYWYSKWKVAPLSERDPEAYRQSMIDAGRGHLVRER